MFTGTIKVPKKLIHSISNHCTIMHRLLLIMLVATSVAGANDSDDVAALDDVSLLLLEESEGSNVTRVKKGISPDKVTRKVSMLFERDGVMEDSSNLTTADFIIRLQEKYEYRLCETYVLAVPDPQNNFFQYDRSLVEPLEGDEVHVEEKAQKIEKTMPYRYRMYDEPCNPANEWDFWHELFLSAENDSTVHHRETIPMLEARKPGDPEDTATSLVDSGENLTARTTHPSTSQPLDLQSSPRPDPVLNKENYIHLQYNTRALMTKWNDIWKKYQVKEICNPRLLLECLPEEEYDNELGWLPIPDTTTYKCLCRKNGIGLPTVIQTPVIHEKRPTVQRDYYTTQNYYDDVWLVNDKEERKYGKYRHTLACAMRVNVPHIGYDVYFTNPCDFFLPMIGMCRAECVTNASCASVDGPEKEAARRRAETDLVTRVAARKLHETYHNKCVCKKGMHCRKLSAEELSSAPKLESFFNYLLVLASIITHACHLIF